MKPTRTFAAPLAIMLGFATLLSSAACQWVDLPLPPLPAPSPPGHPPGPHDPPHDPPGQHPGEDPPACFPRPQDRHRFSIVVLPDTQYLFDQDRGNPAVLAATLNWVVEHRRDKNIVFVAQLGDLVQNAGPAELDQVSDVFGILDRAHVPYSVLAGNHDLRHSGSSDDQRMGEPYLVPFSNARFAGRPDFVAGTDNGFNRAHVFEGGGRKWLLLALDWRTSKASRDWARAVIDQHPGLPVVVTTHDLAFPDVASAAGDAALSEHGQQLWDDVIKDRDQVFLTLNGHYWPPGRTLLKNAAGHDVSVQITNYQDRYFGGSGMIRLYEFDLDRDTIDVSTFSPWVLGRCPSARTPLERAEAELTGAADRFVLPVDFSGRLGAPPPAEPPPAPPASVIGPGTLAYWRFDAASTGPVAAGGVVVPDLAAHGNDLERVTLPAGQANDLVWTSEHHPLQPGHGSLFFKGAKTNPPPGAYLRTIAGAPLNGMQLEHGYTIEAFLRLPTDCCDNHAFMGVLTRAGTGGDAGKTGDDPSEPQATLTVSNLREMQWAIFPLNRDAIATNWSHDLPTLRWSHVAIVNDGHHSVMYVDGSLVLRNPRAESIGISTSGGSSNDSWIVGGYQYDHIVEQAFYGWLGDVRITDHALTVEEFMNHPR